MIDCTCVTKIQIYLNSVGYVKHGKAHLKYTSLAFFMIVVTNFRCRDNSGANMPSVLHPADIFCLILHQINCLFKHKISSNYNLFS